MQWPQNQLGLEDNQEVDLDEKGEIKHHEVMQNTDHVIQVSSDLEKLDSVDRAIQVDSDLEKLDSVDRVIQVGSDLDMLDSIDCAIQVGPEDCLKKKTATNVNIKPSLEKRKKVCDKSSSSRQ